MANGSNYHQLFANFDPNNAAVAAAAAAANQATSSSQQAVSNTNTPSSSTTQITAEMLKRELINQKVRADNRERKKRWREQNEERNKDNDLRCRVNKRAHKLFGKDDSEHKRRWIEEEFLKRQLKRKEKERRKQAVNGAIGANTGGGHSDSGSSNLDLAGGQPHLDAQQLQALHETNYLSMLCNNLGALSPTAAAKLLSNSNVGSAAKAQEKSQQLSLQLLDFLQQLQQYQPQQQQASTENPTSTDYQLPTQTFSTSSSPNSSETSTPMQHDSTRPEDRLAALLSSSIHSAATAAASANNSQPATKQEGESSSSAVKKDSSQQSEGSQSQQQQQQQQRQQQGSGGDYPMDAVLTLMQLNAGWRQ
ncbi:uncharacterized protein BYT42DRAFT_300079 [Radiomyces spectabilis]|uniref:uncharacterized protein n=1 Tax=Radiomyces spectabilis TaxID=64574 RepID=UPI00221F5D30|nr:uncharacterized protein BYT42DRAFT_300079 [Radiomyces spectabilis]KAI8381284.1 hypothetical protein BYT42DRAFT_300079 [Radiomyces spectabilis]